MANYAIIGASGLIGGYLLQEVLSNTESSVTIIVRNQLAIAHPRLQQLVVKSFDQSILTSALNGFDAVFVAIGTTQAKVGSDSLAYRKVDYDIPVAVANACASNQIPRLLVVSSVGASSGSSNFYLRLKGEVEDYITALSIPYIGFFQPSLLLGNRQEFRLGEKIAQYLLPLLSPLLPQRYRPIHARTVALSMLRNAQAQESGINRYSYKAMVAKF